MAFKKQENKSGLINIGALWEGKKTGVLTGSFDRDNTAFEEAIKEHGFAGLRIVVLANNFAKKETDPAFKLLVSVKEEGYGAKNRREEPAVEEAAPAPKKGGRLPWDKSK